jgi:CRP/FNR family cyclic AMP-dependent transcriptional regulator
MKFLGKVELFENLVLGDIDFLLDELRECTFEEGEWVIREGEEGGSLYIVESGSVDVIKEEGDGGETQLARLGPGEFFGEMSLMNSRPRSASICTRESTVLLKLSRDNFQDMLSRNHRTSLKVTYNIARVLGERLDDMNQKLDRATGGE